MTSILVRNTKFEKNQHKITDFKDIVGANEIPVQFNKTD